MAGRKNSAEPPWGDETPGDEAEPLTGSRSARGPVSDLRAALREDATAGYERLASFFDQALDATKETFVTCGKCGKRNPAVVSDWTARTTALRLMLETGYGKPPAEETKSSGRSLEELSDAELRAGLIAIYATEACTPTFLAEKLAADRAELDEIEQGLAAGEAFIPDRGWVSREDVTVEETAELGRKFGGKATTPGYYYEALSAELARAEKQS